MPKFKGIRIPFVVRVILALVVAFVIMTLTEGLSPEATTNRLTIFFGAVSLILAVLDGLHARWVALSILDQKMSFLNKSCIERIDEAVALIRRGTRGTAICYRLTSIEDILIDYCKCCGQGDKEKFRNHKGHIASTKTVIETAEIDNSIVVDYVALIRIIQDCRTDLREM